MSVKKPMKVATIALHSGNLRSSFHKMCCVVSVGVPIFTEVSTLCAWNVNLRYGFYVASCTHIVIFCPFLLNCTYLCANYT